MLGGSSIERRRQSVLTLLLSSDTLKVFRRVNWVYSDDFTGRYVLILTLLDPTISPRC